ncbi:MAG: N-acetyl-gamma-glutamyl-phosphate reductase [Candidatus Methylarchaceae archaeon HK02M1]|nr:N-acetyl-gamma-glutamyl-phosphate reductase [Candidatus Methylarchaceae archaeon HK01M]MCP8311603.1 N-acetyl-gamma-glutamyl-phosphate reductase [Candidatus Methylarchaceae archaeon HK02M1]
MKLKVGIVGASGYVGGELLRILLFHPQVEVTCVTSKRYVGDYVHHVHSNLRGITDLKFIDHNSEEIADKCDLIFFSLPHGSSVKMIPDYVDKGKKIIDLSADFRLKDREDYPKWYGYEHPFQDLLKKFVYGVPELHREEIKNSSLIACPGCMAVASILPLAPLIKSNLIEKDRIVVDVKIGSSGAGAAPSPATHHAIRFGVIRPYKPVGHRHTAEIEQELDRLSGGNVKIAMSAHAVNIVRGILATCHTFTLNHLTIRDLWKIYRGFYQGEPFIRLVRDMKGLYKLPDPKVVIGSNYCDIGFETDEHIDRVVVFSAIDNLMKGAAGTAVQNMNIMLGLDEKTGLQSPGLHPV